MYDIINNKPVLAEEHYIIPLIAAAAIGAGASLIGGAVSASSQKKVNEANIESQERMNALNLAFQSQVNAQNQSNFERSFDYMAQQNLIQQQREDTAHQREVQDLIKAGLSPLASTSGSTTGSLVSTPSSPMLNSFNGVAPQADATGFLETGASISRVGELVKDFYSIDSETKRSDARNETELSISSAQLANSLQQVREQIASNKDISDSQLANSYQISLDKMEHDINLLNLTNSYDSSKQAKIMSHEMKQKLMDKGVHNFKEYTDFNEYKAAKAVYDKLALEHINSNVSRLKKTLSANSNSFNLGGSFGKGNSEGTNRSIAGEIFDKVTSAANLNFAANGGKSSSDMSSVDDSLSYFEYKDYFHMKHPYPLYVGN